MNSLPFCPRCGRGSEDSFTFDWFAIYTCRKCQEKYCEDCGHGSDGTLCPECENADYSVYEEVCLK